MRKRFHFSVCSFEGNPIFGWDIPPNDEGMGRKIVAMCACGAIDDK